ncbi:MAG: methyltransferase [Bacteroidetes bacterium]|nr:methyltransferase [Bacteroidota bacterium]
MFRFKQFTVVQDHAAMKVCTDACLFGALIETVNHQNILDIGTGTGLLALMMAQKNQNAVISAIEIDNEAVIDAKYNIENSPFSSKIELFHTSIQEFQQNKKYDCIISNPPFFQNNLKSPHLARNKALHNHSLTLSELANIIMQLLVPEGDTWILLPPYEMSVFRAEIQNFGFAPNKKFVVKHDPSKAPFREICCFSRLTTGNCIQEVINIYESGIYSARFVELLKDYYLIF